MRRRILARAAALSALILSSCVTTTTSQVGAGDGDSPKELYIVCVTGVFIEILAWPELTLPRKYGLAKVACEAYREQLLSSFQDQYDRDVGQEAFFEFDQRVYEYLVANLT